MSLLNSWIAPEKALIACDTQVIDRHGVRSELSKLIPLVHANLILATRGHIDFLSLVFIQCNVTPCDFDWVSDRMPQVLDHSFECLIAAGRLNGFTDLSVFDKQSILMVGWSKSRCQMHGKFYLQETPKTGFIGQDVNSYCVNPWEPNRGSPVVPNGKAELEQLALAQIHFMRRTWPDAACGGRLLIAELDRKGMTIEEVCSL